MNNGENTEVVFDQIKPRIISELNKCRTSVQVAVAWMTDSDLFEKLLDLAKKGIAVEIVLNDDDINRASKLSYYLLNINGGQIYNYDSRLSLMHNKFCLIDKETAISGSFNWTFRASDNHENIIVTREVSVVQKFFEEFEILKSKSVITGFKQSENHLFDLYANKLDLEEIKEKAETYFERKLYEISLKYYLKYISHPQNATYYNLHQIGLCHLYLKNYEDAIKYFTECINVNNKSSYAYNNLAICLENIDFILEAQHYFDKAINSKLELIYLNNRIRVRKKIMNLSLEHENYIDKRERWDNNIDNELARGRRGQSKHVEFSEQSPLKVRSNELSKELISNFIPLMKRMTSRRTIEIYGIISDTEIILNSFSSIDRKHYLSSIIVFLNEVHHYTDCLQFYSAWISEFGYNYDYVLKRAKIYESQGKFDLAIKDAQLLVLKRPNDTRASERLGDLQYQQRKQSTKESKPKKSPEPKGWFSKIFG